MIGKTKLLQKRRITMATKKKSTGKGRVQVNKLKVQKEKVLMAKDSKRVRGGVAPRTPLKKIKID